DARQRYDDGSHSSPPERSHPSRRRWLGAVVAENRTPRGRVRTRPSPRPAVQNWDSKVEAATHARPLAWLLTCLFCLLVLLSLFLLTWGRRQPRLCRRRPVAGAETSPDPRPRRRRCLPG